MKLWIYLFLISLTGLASLPAAQAAPGESEVQAAGITAQKIAHWLQGLEGRPGKLAIAGVHAAPPLGIEYSNLLESEILRQVAADRSLEITSCLECRSPQLRTEGENVVVTKGTPDVETMRRLGQKTGAQAFLSLDVFRTRFSVVTEATLYKSSNGDILGIEQFRVAAFELSSSSVLFLLRGGPGDPAPSAQGPGPQGSTLRLFPRPSPRK